MGFTSVATRLAAKVDRGINSLISAKLARMGWVPTVQPFTGYGTDNWARVFCRIVMRREVTDIGLPDDLVRGWRNFTAVNVPNMPVTVTAGDKVYHLASDTGGYIDAVIGIDTKPGWRSVTFTVGDSEPVEAPVVMIGPKPVFGLVSDIDDTVVVTSLPRPLIAAWNSFVLNEHARRPVPGMNVMYERLTNAHPGMPVVYLSTGAWNVAETLTRFLSRNLYPAGPLLLTDWGPNDKRFFRSGQEHKRQTLTRLARELPQVRWILVGDDGQHDAQLYTEFAATYPKHVAAVAIRHLSPTEQVLASGLPVERRPWLKADNVPWVSAPNGALLARELERLGLMSRMTSETDIIRPDNI